MGAIDVIAAGVLAIFWLLFLLYEEVRAIRRAVEDAEQERLQSGRTEADQDRGA